MNAADSIPRLNTVQRIAQDRPFLFVVGLFLVEAVSAFPFVIAFNVLELDREPLRLIIPAAQSALVLWVVWLLGWFRRAGFTGSVTNLHLYGYPVLLAFVPVLFYGTVAIPVGPLAFYAAALLFTGLSEETLARGLILPALLPRGKWTAVFFAAALFSVGHLTNLFFEDFGPLEMAEVLLATFGFAVLYGALFLRTANLWPLIFLHTLHDFAFLTSGTAGPFVADPLSPTLSIGLAILNVAYGVWILAGPKGDAAGRAAGPPARMIPA